MTFFLSKTHSDITPTLALLKSQDSPELIQSDLAAGTPLLPEDSQALRMYWLE